MTTMTDNEQDVQNEVGDIMRSAETVVDSLSCAESCETVEDLRSNLEEAEENLKTILKEVQELLVQLKKKKKKMATA